MNWFYFNEAGEVVGPLSEETLRELHAIGRLAATTQVCREGSEDWISLAEALGTFTATPAGGGESVVTSAAPTVINTLPQSHRTPGSQPTVQHAARQVRFRGGGTTRQATPPRSTGKKWALILGAIGGLAAVIVGFVFVTSKHARNEGASSPDPFGPKMIRGGDDRPGSNTSSEKPERANDRKTTSVETAKPIGPKMIRGGDDRPGSNTSSEKPERANDRKTTSVETAKPITPNRGLLAAQDPFTVKGFWIGMKEKDAKNRLREIFGNDLSFTKEEELFQGHLEVFSFESPLLTKLDNYPYLSEQGSCLINIDVKSRELHALSVAGHHLDRMFDSKGVDIKNFSQQFMKNFRISNLHIDPRVGTPNFPFVSFYVDVGQVKFRLISLPEDLHYKEFSMDYIPKASF